MIQVNDLVKICTARLHTYTQLQEEFVRQLLVIQHISLSILVNNIDNYVAIHNDYKVYCLQRLIYLQTLKEVSARTRDEETTSSFHVSIIVDFKKDSINPQKTNEGHFEPSTG